MNKNTRAFTLAEMMVVMLILTIILAAFAPLVTKRKAVDISNPWRYSANNSDTYYGVGAKQTAMIGQNEKASTDPDTRLLIKTSNDKQAYLTFKNSEQGVLGGIHWQAADNGGGTLRMGGVYTNNPTGGNNLAVGYQALQKVSSGSNNTALGTKSLSVMTTASNNTAIGSGALQKVTSGTGNTAIGYNACANVTGSNKTCIGANSGPSSSFAANSNSEKVIYLGDADTTVYIPGNVVVGKSFQVAKSFAVGADYGTYIKAGQNVYLTGFAAGYPFFGAAGPYTLTDKSTTYSDKRLKNIKSENRAGLEKIRELKVFDYTFKKDNDNKPQVGVIAQDLQKVFPDAVTKADDGYLKIRWDDMFYAVINSVKQLDTLVQGIINELKVHIERITNVENRVKALEEENKLLKEQIADINKRLEKLEK